jgi:hypothetical protein
MTSEPVFTSSSLREPENVRHSHLRQESGIKSVGQLCYLVAFFSILGTIEFALFAVGILSRAEFKAVAPDSWLDAFFGTFTVVFGLNALAQVVLGRGLIRLKSWARWTVVALTIFSLGMSTLSSLIFCLSGTMLEEFEPLIGFKVNGLMVGLLSLVIGGLAHLIILWPLIGPGSGVIFSDDYREVVRQTSKIKSRMHWLLKALIVVILLIVLGFVLYLLGIYYRIID